jgi:serine/threonine protein kinase
MILGEELGSLPMVETTHSKTNDRYEVLGELGTGGMATVYLARLRAPLGFSRLVAIKCMHAQYVKDPAFTEMFLDEARLTAQIRHQNVISTIDVVAADGQLINVMEYVEGETLATILERMHARGEHIPVSVACTIMEDVLCGLHAAHEVRDQGGEPLAIVHRDVSPANIIIGLDGVPRVLDFGVAKARKRLHHTSDGQIKGKIGYMAPEQLFGEEVDRTADVYSAGVTLWEALVGERLFDGASDAMVAARVAEGAVAPPSRHVGHAISETLDALVLRAMSLEPKNRFPTALAMAKALRDASPLASRLEVSRWVREFARPRPEPSGALDARAREIVSLLARDRLETTALVSKRRARLEHGRIAIIAASIATLGLLVVMGVFWFARTTPSPPPVLAPPVHAEKAISPPPPVIAPAESPPPVATPVKRTSTRSLPRRVVTRPASGRSPLDHM